MLPTLLLPLRPLGVEISFAGGRQNRSLRHEAAAIRLAQVVANTGVGLASRGDATLTSLNRPSKGLDLRLIDKAVAVTFRFERNRPSEEATQTLPRTGRVAHQDSAPFLQLHLPARRSYLHL